MVFAAGITHFMMGWRYRTPYDLKGCFGNCMFITQFCVEGHGEYPPAYRFPFQFIIVLMGANAGPVISFVRLHAFIQCPQPHLNNWIMVSFEYQYATSCFAHEVQAACMIQRGQLWMWYKQMAVIQRKVNNIISIYLAHHIISDDTSAPWPWHLASPSTQLCVFPLNKTSKLPYIRTLVMGIHQWHMGCPYKGSLMRMALSWVGIILPSIINHAHNWLIRNSVVVYLFCFINKEPWWKLI